MSNALQIGTMVKYQGSIKELHGTTWLIEFIYEDGRLFLSEVDTSVAPEKRKVLERVRVQSVTTQLARLPF